MLENDKDISISQQYCIEFSARIFFLNHRYLSTWFIMDVASTIPLQGLEYLLTRQVRESISYGVLGVLRLWRLRKVSVFFTR
jgi:potassium channel